MRKLRADQDAFATSPRFGKDDKSVWSRFSRQQPHNTMTELRRFRNGELDVRAQGAVRSG